MGARFISAGALAADNTTTTLAITAPSANIGDVFVAFILAKDNQAITRPSNWFDVETTNNGAAMRTSTFWHGVVAGDSGAGFNFTKPVDNNLLFCGLICCYRGVDLTTIFGGSTTISVNASADNVTYASFTSTREGLCVAAGYYANDLTTPGAVSGTGPTFTLRAQPETSLGSDASIFVSDGYILRGVTTGGRTQASNSTADAINNGVLFNLVSHKQKALTILGVGR